MRHIGIFLNITDHHIHEIRDRPASEISAQIDGDILEAEHCHITLFNFAHERESDLEMHSILVNSLSLIIGIICLTIILSILVVK